MAGEGAKLAQIRKEKPGKFQTFHIHTHTGMTDFDPVQQEAQSESVPIYQFFPWCLHPVLDGSLSKARASVGGLRKYLHVAQNLY